ncbi:MAG TPA: hypothetical protein VFA94_15210 [Acidimicrobiales bacterium]|nr:hypothetical protein [Acidimicrobiales bacterium]
MNERRWERIGAEAGIVFVVLGVIAQFLPGKPPAQNASGQTLITWIADHHSKLMWSIVLWSLASVAGLLFLATVRARLSEAEGGHSELATAAVVGGVFAFALNWVGGAMGAMSAYREGIGLPASTVRALWDGSNVSAMLAGIGGALFAGCVAAVVMSTGLLPRWIGWLAGVVTVAQLAGLFSPLASSGAFAPGGGFSVVVLLSVLVLFLAVAVEFLVHAEAPAPTTAPRGVPA